MSENYENEIWDLIGRNSVIVCSLLKDLMKFASLPKVILPLLSIYFHCQSYHAFILFRFLSITSRVKTCFGGIINQ